MKDVAKKILKVADIEINGIRPWDIQVKNEKLFQRILSGGSLALGESYMDGWWECEAIDQMIDRILRARINKKVRVSADVVWNVVKAKTLNMQNKTRSKIVGEQHYDVGNELYKRMLDKNMCYSCGYWKNTKNLDEAQEAKLDLICKKLKLKPGLKVLDIGCGWGSFSKFAAEKYGVKIVGITISKEQKKLAEERCKGLDVEIRLQDYRDMDEKFDRILSIGMFEHVGYKNYKAYFEMIDRCLEENGITLLHTIGRMETGGIAGDPWLNKYIFPGGALPSVYQIAGAADKLLRLEDWHNFGPDYDLTLMEWYKNFNESWDEIKGDYDERFRRMWNYYLLSCAAIFRSRTAQLWQVVFARIDSSEKYESER